MADLNAMLAFLVAALAIELTPGPNMGWLAATTLRSGPRAGLAAVAGITLGLAVLAGISGTLAPWMGAPSGLGHTTWNQLAHWVGAGLMAWFAWEAWQTAPTVAVGTPAAGGAFARGLITNLVNVKAALALTALPAAFTAASADPARLHAVLAGLYLLTAVAVHLAVVGLAERFRARLTSGARAAAGRGAALVMAAMAVWMAVQAVLAARA